MALTIAFASCLCARLYPDQPVWDDIAARQPDALVLLGDSIYLDVGQVPHPDTLSDNAFAERLIELYRLQLAQPRFAALVQQLPAGRVFSTWDDHDFLWDNALGAEATANPVHAGKVALSTAAQRAWRHTLATRLAPGSFPATVADLQTLLNADPLPTPSTALPEDVHLHLLDGRTHRTRTFLLADSKRTMLGAAQQDAVGAAMAAVTTPQAVHLVASGSTLAGWEKYARDLAWLHGLAAQRRTLVLSGDIHYNKVDAFHTGGLPLHEATSSGAALRDGVVAGQLQQNFGLLTIDAQAVQVQLFKRNSQQTALARRLDRGSWLPQG